MTAAEDEFTAYEIEEARKLFSGACDFMLGVAGLKQLPPADMPEITFAGRSNVGKSSLLNALTGRNTLARTSNTPGRTQQLNFFNLGGQIYMVDMPGYGYAKVSKTVREDWNGLIRNYLRGRPNLRCVYILIDARHGLKESDHEIMTMLDETAVSYRIVLTKGDKCHPNERPALAEKVETALKKHAAAFPKVHFTSAIKDEGLPELRALIRRFTVQQ
ncbi:MAG: ribosome biogenesis GTP-binding protein YihA/YsxC [Alphaproteobacteria bacterium]